MRRRDSPDDDRRRVISIHAPRAGCDLCDRSAFRSLRLLTYFNPRAPCGARLPADSWRPTARDFNPRAPCGARQCRRTSSCGSMGYFNPRAPCGARRTLRSRSPRKANFNPRAPCGARPARKNALEPYKRFQSTRPVWGATLSGLRPVRLQATFQSTRPVWSATPALWHRCRPAAFQSTRPVWGATTQTERSDDMSDISIHAPRVGRDDHRYSSLDLRCISIHAPRVGRDPLFARIASAMPLFQSTRPVWGATWYSRGYPMLPRDFNPRAPCGARPQSYIETLDQMRISIHAPRVGRDLYAS